MSATFHHKPCHGASAIAATTYELGGRPPDEACSSAAPSKPLILLYTSKTLFCIAAHLPVDPAGARQVGCTVLVPPLRDLWACPIGCMQLNRVQGAAGSHASLHKLATRPPTAHSAGSLLRRKRFAQGVAHIRPVAACDQQRQPQKGSHQRGSIAAHATAAADGYAADAGQPDTLVSSTFALTKVILGAGGRHHA